MCCVSFAAQKKVRGSQIHLISRFQFASLKLDDCGTKSPSEYLVSCFGRVSQQFSCQKSGTDGTIAAVCSRVSSNAAVVYFYASRLFGFETLEK